MSVLILPSIGRIFDGIPKPLMIAAGVTQMLCLAICILAALTSAVTMFAGKQKRTHSWQYLLNIAGNAVTVLTIVCFHMYQFWGC